MAAQAAGLTSASLQAEWLGHLSLCKGRKYYVRWRSAVEQARQLDASCVVHNGGESARKLRAQRSADGGVSGIGKPTGNRGPIRIYGTFPDIKVEYQRVEFPQEKAEIEAFIVDGFLRSLDGTAILQAPFHDLRQNKTDDFDFTDVAASRPTHLELVEIAPLEGERGGYSAASSSYRTFDFAQQALEKMLAKSGRYAVSGETRLCLLMYTTDWHFELSDTVVTLLQYWTGEKQHIFSEVYAFTPSAAGAGHPHLIHPVPRSFFEGFNPEEYRNSETYNMDPEQGVLQIDQAGGALSFGWDVSLNPSPVPVVGGNQPCPCGSGREYRHCHGT